MTIKKYLNDLISEKSGIDMETTLEIEGPSGLNIMPLQVLVDAIVQAPANEQKGIRNMLVRIDFNNGDVLDYFRHLGQAIAI
jgi:hypothetical protein